MPEVSVIVPVYGVEKYLRECLDSILAQTMKDLEIILIDDGGKDKCPEIIDEYAEKDSRITAIHKANGGYGQTCNVGLTKATGEYIAIVEPDDFIAPEMYSVLYQAAKANNADVVKSPFYANYLGTEKPSALYLCRPYNSKVNPPETAFRLKDFPYFISHHPSIWSCIYKRDFIEKHNIRFIEAPGAGWTDNPFQVQTLFLADRIFYVNKPFYYWRLFYFNELKDFSIPLLRSVEIHNWMKKVQVDDENIRACLYSREACYLKMIHEKIALNKLRQYYFLLNDYKNTVDFDFIRRTGLLTKRDKIVYFLIKNLPLLVILYQKIICLQKKIFTIRISKRNFYIRLLGKKYVIFS